MLLFVVSLRDRLAVEMSSVLRAFRLTVEAAAVSASGAEAEPSGVETPGLLAGGWLFSEAGTEDDAAMAWARGVPGLGGLRET